MLENIVIVLAIIIILFALYRYLRGFWLRRMMEQWKEAKRPRKPMVLKLKSDDRCA